MARLAAVRWWAVPPGVGRLVAGWWAVLGIAGGAAGCDVALGVDDFSADGCPAVGARRCSGDTLQTCGADGEWRDLRACTEGCRDGACAIECLPGQRRCAGDVPQACSPGGQWVKEGDPCPASAPCSGGQCGAVCAPGDLRCDGEAAQSCTEEGQWQGNGPCPMGCLNGLCAECVPKERACENKTPRVCNNDGQWEIGAPCNKDQQCSESGTCENK